MKIAHVLILVSYRVDRMRNENLKKYLDRKKWKLGPSGLASHPPRHIRAYHTEKPYHPRNHAHFGRERYCRQRRVVEQTFCTFPGAAERLLVDIVEPCGGTSILWMLNTRSGLGLEFGSARTRVRTSVRIRSGRASQGQNSARWRNDYS